MARSVSAKLVICQVSCLAEAQLASCSKLMRDQVLGEMDMLRSDTDELLTFGKGTGSASCGSCSKPRSVSAITAGKLLVEARWSKLELCDALLLDHLLNKLVVCRGVVSSIMQSLGSTLMFSHSTADLIAQGAENSALPEMDDDIGSAPPKRYPSRCAALRERMYMACRCYHTKGTAYNAGKGRDMHHSHERLPVSAECPCSGSLRLQSHADAGCHSDFNCRWPLVQPPLLTSAAAPQLVHAVPPPLAASLLDLAAQCVGKRHARDHRLLHWPRCRCPCCS